MKIIRNKSLMKQIMKYFLIVIFLMFLINVYSIISFKQSYTNIYSSFVDISKSYDISVRTDELYEIISNYTHSGSENYSTEYGIKYLQLKKMVYQFKNNSFDRVIYNHYSDIYNMIETFNSRSIEIIKDTKGSRGKIYINKSVYGLYQLKTYINNEVQSLLLVRLSKLSSNYNFFKNKISNNENLSYLATILVTMLCLFISYRFSRHISKPIHSLVLRLKKVANGEFDDSPLISKNINELDKLIDSYNYMNKRIKELIHEINDNALFETQLKEERIKNLEMKNLLNQAELKFLQSQINPHFLFNTLNTIAILSDIEEAPQTKKVIESLSDIFKYNLKKSDEMVTLEDECKIVKDYLYIQRVRFGDRITFKVNIDNSIMYYKVPGMILQPFVENALIHGLEQKVGKGLLEINIYGNDANIIISIKDNGVGMTKEMLATLNDLKNIKTKESLGIINVMKRLVLKYGYNVVEIKGKLGVGTSIILTLPKNIQNYQ